MVADINGNVLEIDNLARDTAHNADITTGLTADLAKAMAAVTREMQQFRFENDEWLVLSQAKSSHLSWKGRLREFLDGKSHLSAEQAVSHHQCDFGIWYYNEGRSRFGDMPEFRTIEQPHEEIHRLIKEIITQQTNNDESGAEATFKRVSTLSDQIVKRIDDLVQRLR